MKKLSLLVLTLTFCSLVFLPAAHAERFDLADKDFDFHQIKTMLIYDPDVELMKQADPVGSDLMIRVAMADYQKEGADEAPYALLSPDQLSRKISLQLGRDLDRMMQEDPEQAGSLLTANCGQFIDAYIRTVLTEYHTGSYMVPAHTEWKQIEESDTYTDRDGHQHTITHTRQIPQYIPDVTVNTATVRLRFIVYNAKTGKEIFARDDSRTDDYSTDLRDAYKKVVHSFFRDLKKKIR